MRINNKLLALISNRNLRFPMNDLGLSRDSFCLLSDHQGPRLGIPFTLPYTQTPSSDFGGIFESSFLTSGQEFIL